MKSARRTTVILVLLLLMVVSAAVDTSGKPVTSMTDAPKGKIEFQTLTLNRQDFWNGVKAGQAVTISGELMLPKGDGRVPAIIMSHGGAGISGTEETWARELRAQGIAVFVVDSFTGRGIKQFPSEAQLSRAGQVYDVYQALALLATHPRIDPARIALMGPSRGGGLTILAAMTRSREAQLPERVDFCAYLAFYPAVNSTFDYGTLASRPIRIFTGSLDEAIPIAVVRTFAEKQRATGADIKLVEYEGAHHAFDNPDVRTPFVVRNPTISFTVLYAPQAHTKAKNDMKETLAEIFGKP